MCHRIHLAGDMGMFHMDTEGFTQNLQPPKPPRQRGTPGTNVQSVIDEARAWRVVVGEDH
jgi:hypothetical protein